MILGTLAAEQQNVPQQPTQLQVNLIQHKSKEVLQKDDEVNRSWELMIPMRIPMRRP